jgi:hypothetical protein
MLLRRGSAAPQAGSFWTTSFRKLRIIADIFAFKGYDDTTGSNHLPRVVGRVNGIVSRKFNKGRKCHDPRFEMHWVCVALAIWFLCDFV